MSESSKAVFLSYAREDADAARRIAEALRSAGIEVWLDETELGGGDAWDQKIRKQIKDCALFVPVISASTQARREGYFRREWRLAVERMHDMDDHLPFLVPVVIDDTADAAAFVPDRFRERQWVRLRLAQAGGTGSSDSLHAFCARIGRLLGGDLDVTSRRLAAVQPAHSTVGRRARAWLVPSLISAAVVFALVIAKPWGAKPSAAATSKTQLSPAQELVAKARTVLEQGDEVNRETYALAEQLLQKAEAADVAEPSAWALHARLSSEVYMMQLDRSAARREALRTEAERAGSLAPGERENEFAAAYAQYAFGQYDAVMKRLEALLQKNPNDVQLLRLLARTYVRLGNMSEGLQVIDRILRLKPDAKGMKSDQVNALLAAGRFADAEKIIREAAREQRDGRLLTFDVQLKLTWTGDLPGAMVAIKDWPAWLLLEDRGIAMAGIAALWSRDGAKALEIVQRSPRDYLRDYFYTGPKAVLTAWAHETAGHTEAARADWRIALQVAERELVAEPDNVVALYWKGYAQARLGDSSAAEVVLRQFQERRPPVSSLAQIAGGFAGLALMLGRTEDAIAEIDRLRPDPSNVIRPITKTLLRLNPLFDPLRKDSRFQALVDRAPGPDKSSPAAQPPTDFASAKSVAVLAFKNLTDEKDFFSDGISDELLNVLGRVPGLRVAGRESAFKFKGQPASPQEIGQLLGVSHLISGSVRKMGSRLRVYAELTSAADGFRLWSDTIEKDATDVFAVQEEIAALVTQNLQLKLETPRAIKPVNPQAHQLVLEGRFFLGLRDPDSLSKARSAFTRAIDLSPEFAAAHAGLAEVFIIGATYAIQDGANYSTDWREDVRRGEVAARRAIELDPVAPDGFAVLGYQMLLGGRYREAEEQFQKAFALNPNHSVSFSWQSVLLLCEGKLDLARRSSDKSYEIDPLWTANVASRTEILLYCRQFEDALRVSDRVQTMRPGYVPDLGARVRVQFALGRQDEAIETARTIRRNLAQHPRRDADSAAIWVLRQAGLAVEAEAHAAEYLQTLPSDSQQRGFVLGALGKFEEAVPYLERTPPVPRRRLYWDQMWDPWRNDPRFAQLMTKLGATAEYNTARSTLAQLVAQQRTDRSGATK